MASDLPEEFDVIVLGTGLPETLVAAAFSRIGLTVLHLDRNSYYSGSWANFSLKQVPGWLKDQEKAECFVSELDEEKLSALVKEGEARLELPATFQMVFEPHSQYHVGEKPNVETATAVSSTPDSEKVPTIQSTETSSDAEAAVETPETEPSQPSGPPEPAQADSAAGSSDTVPGQFDSAPDPQDMQTENGQEQATPEAGKPACDSSEAKKKQRREWFSDDIEKEWRKFNFDLAPKLLYCTGSMVELLIVSDVAKYCEFRTVSRVLTMRDHKLEKVPCSRADVFSSKALSLLEKRLLMKFLTFAAEYDKQPSEYEDFLNKPFVDFLASKKLSAKIQYFVLHSIAMATESTSTKQGLENTQKFLRSLGRYGNTAFLFPLYGSGELPQGFCRLSAVFGGIYVLTMSPSHLLMDSENRCSGVITSAGQRIKCKYLIADPSYLPKEFYHVPEESRISRGIFVTDSSILPDEAEDLSLLQLPHEGQPSSSSTTLLELPPSAMVSPRDLYVVHATRRSVSDVQSDLHPVTSALFHIPGAEDTAAEESSSGEATEEPTKPRLLWSLCFQQRDLSHVERSDQTPPNVFVVNGPGTELDTDRCVEEAKAIFKEICPEEEFLPKPPHPDDIIYVDTEEVPAAGNEQGDWASDADKTGGPETTTDASSTNQNPVGAQKSEKEDGKEKGDNNELKENDKTGGLEATTGASTNQDPAGAQKSEKEYEKEKGDDNELKESEVEAAQGTTVVDSGPVSKEKAEETPDKDAAES